MAERLQDLLREIRELEEQVGEELNKQKEKWSYQIQRGRVRFEQAIIPEHKQVVVHWFSYLADASLPVMLTAPLIYSLAIPLLLLDLFVSIYHLVCFPIYGIPKVPRRDYIVIDRHHLRYLNVIERAHCVYCSYGNGLLAWVMEVAARTEQYWCPVKHAQSSAFMHSRYRYFFDYGDAKAYAEQIKELRYRFDDLKDGEK